MLRERKSLLEKANQVALNDRLVEWVRADPENDRLVESVRPTLENASAPDSDSVRASAELLSRLDEGNGAAWVPEFNAALSTNDAVKVDVVLTHIAEAERFDDLYIESLKTWQNAIERYPQALTSLMKAIGSSMDEAELAAALTIQSANEMPGLWVAPLMDVCSHKDHPEADNARFVNCRKVGRLMFNHATTIDNQLTGFMLLRESATVTPDDVEALRLLKWQLQQRARITQSLMIDRTILRTSLAEIIATGSENAALQRMLLRAGVSLTPPKDWQPYGVSTEPTKSDAH